jgi:hypothetical protein
MMSNAAEDRLHELLVQEATESLGADERAELERLLAAHPVDRELYHRLAAQASLAGAIHAETPPADLMRRVTAVGEAYLAGAGRRGPAPAPGRARGRERWGWYAAAASVLLAVAGWYPRLAPAPAAPLARTESPEDAAIRARADLLARPGLVRSNFSGTADPNSGGVEGDVVWDPASQRGFLRLRGLPANDRSVAQYQLWVFDAERDQRFPVDGGVFDVPADRAEAIVPIRVPIRVGQAVLFAVTVERPGGVVVSGREHIVATAKPDAT